MINTHNAAHTIQKCWKRYANNKFPVAPKSPSSTFHTMVIRKNDIYEKSLAPRDPDFSHSFKNLSQQLDAWEDYLDLSNKTPIHRDYLAVFLSVTSCMENMRFAELTRRTPYQRLFFTLDDKSCIQSVAVTTLNVQTKVVTLEALLSAPWNVFPTDTKHKVHGAASHTLSYITNMTLFHHRKLQIYSSKTADSFYSRFADAFTRSTVKGACEQTIPYFMSR